MFFIYAVAALIFCAFTVLAVGYMQANRASIARQKFARLSTGPRLMPGSPIAQELQKSFHERVLLPALIRLERKVLALTPSGAVDAAKAKLEMAGNPNHLNVSTYMVLRTIAFVAGVLGGVAVMMLWKDGTITYKYLALVTCIAGGMLMPEMMLDNLVKARQYQITKSTPDIIDLLVVSAEAGTGLDGALMQVCQRKKGPLPDEFERIITEIRLGKRRQEAWQDLARRCGVDDIKNLVAALHQAEELGVSVSNTLRAQADSLRTRRSMRIRTIAATLSVKLLFPLIFCILPALFVVVLGPGMLSITKAFGSLGW